MRNKQGCDTWQYGRQLGMPLLLVGIACLLSLLLSACSFDSLTASTWQVGTLSHQQIHTLVVDISNPQLIYAGDVQGSIFASTDAGQHWAERTPISSSPVTLLFLTEDPSGKKIYASTSTGLIVSSDSAQTWHPLDASSLPTDAYTAPTFTGSQHVYLGTMHHGLYMSNDDATTWRAANVGLPTDIAINSISYDTVQHHLWLATSTGVYRSDDGGTSWRAMNTGFPGGTIVTSIQPAANAGGDSALVYAGTTKGLYLSTDSGAHWTAPAVLQYVYIRQVLVDFRSKNAATVYVATNVGLYRSDDSGQNWAGVGPGIPRDQTVYASAIGAKQASQLYAASNNVYLYPGTSSTGIDPGRVLSLLLILLLFVVLFYVVRRELRRNRKKPQKADENAENVSTVVKKP